jgi:N-terminal 7TM region of histidine kinase
MTLPIIGPRRRPSAAVLLGTGLVLLAAVLVGLSLLARLPEYPLQPIMIAIPSAAVGVLVVRRQPRNPNGWLLIGIAAAILLSTGAGAYSLLVYRLGRSLPLGPAGLVLYQLWSPALALFLLVILLFPDGHPPSPRWRWVAWGYGLLCVVYLGLLIGVAIDAVDGHRIRVDGYGGLTVVDYPVGRFAIAQNVILIVILVLGVCFAGRQFVSWRRSAGDRREQLKWLMFGSAVAIVCAALSIPGQTTPSGIWADLNGVVSIGFIALPVSIGVGILRYRLYEIDLVISRTVVYAIVTGLLVGVYAVLVTTAHRVFADRSPTAVAGATLAAVALFSPLRRRVQRVVDRRFNRAHYDAEATIAAFAVRMQEAADLDEVRSDLLAVAYQVMEPAHVSIWVRSRPETQPRPQP